MAAFGVDLAHMPQTQYYDLTPRRREAQEALSRKLNLGKDAVNASACNSDAAHKPPTKSNKQITDKENCGPVPEGCIIKAQMKRQQVLEEKAASQANERSRLCIFKSREDGDTVGKDAGQKEGGQALAASSLTIPREPCLQTSLRSSSRSASRSCSVSLHGSRSLGEPDEPSVGSRRTSREPSTMRTPERSLSSAIPPSHHFDPSLCSASLLSRQYSTRPLTVPKGPSLATADRGSRGRSVGHHTPRGRTPSHSARPTSAQSARSTSCSRLPSRLLTFPKGPFLATELRSRSRSAGARSPSTHSARSGGSLGPVFSTRRHNRSASAGIRTPSRSVERRERSVDTCNVTVPCGPNLATELRGRSRCGLRRGYRNCEGTPDTYHSCSSNRSCSARNSCRESLPVTIPRGPVLRTEIRSLSRRRTAVSNDGPVTAGSKAEILVELSGIEIASEAVDVVVPSDFATPGIEDKLPTIEAGKASSPNIMMSKSEKDVQQQQLPENKYVEQPKPFRPETQVRMGSQSSVNSNTHDCMPQQTTARLLDRSSPTRRAESRKQQVLAKVAQDHETSREHLFVFSKAASSPSRNRTGKTSWPMTTHRTEASKESLPNLAMASSEHDVQESLQIEEVNQPMPCRPEAHVFADSDSSVISKPHDHVPPN